MDRYFKKYIQDVDSILYVGQKTDYIDSAIDINPDILIFSEEDIPAKKKVGAVLVSDDTKFIGCIRHLEDNAIVFMISENSKLIEKISDSILFNKIHSKDHDHIFNYQHPRIGIVTFAVGDDYVNAVTPGIFSKNNYVNMHNYHILFDPLSLDNTRPLSWSKIRQLQRFLRMYDVIMWIDADTIITNPNVCIEDLLLLMPKSKDIMIGRDLNDINAGVFIMRNSIRSFEFLNEVYSQDDLIHNGWWEQAAIIRLIGSKYQDIAVEIPREFIRIFNAYIPSTDPLHHYQQGDFIIHFAGTKGKILYDLMRAYPSHPDSPSVTHTLIYNMLTKV